MNTPHAELIKELIAAIPDAPSKYSALLAGAAIAIAKLHSCSVECAALKAKIAAMEGQEPLGDGYTMLVITGNTPSTMETKRITILGIPVYAAAGAEPKQRCQHCDDTGDVHGLDGEWRGICTCAAGAAPRHRLTPYQRFDICDAVANLGYDDDFIGDIVKIIAW